MRMIQSSFPRLKEPLRYEEEGDRFLILHLMVNLYNYQTVIMGFNSIFNSYMMNDDGFFGCDIDDFYDIDAY